MRKNLSLAMMILLSIPTSSYAVHKIFCLSGRTFTDNEFRELFDRNGNGLYREIRESIASGSDESPEIHRIDLSYSRFSFKVLDALPETIEELVLFKAYFQHYSHFYSLLLGFPKKSIVSIIAERCPRLVSLNLSETNIGPEDIRNLSVLISLTSLNLAGNRIGDESARNLSTLTSLTTLNLADNRIINEGTKCLLALTSLTNLDLAHNRIGDEGVKCLSALTSLTTLNVADNEISSEGTKYLLALTSLTNLDLAGNRIGDAGAKRLSALTTLVSLDLGNKSLVDLWSYEKVARVARASTDPQVVADQAERDLQAATALCNRALAASQEAQKRFTLNPSDSAAANARDMRSKAVLDAQRAVYEASEYARRTCRIAQNAAMDAMRADHTEELNAHKLMIRALCDRLNIQIPDGF